MFEQNNLLALLFTFVPALIYSAIVYFTIMPGVIKLRVASLFFSMGVLSTLLVNAVHYAFPNWKASSSEHLLLSLFIMAFVKIALLEEGSKFFMFKLTEWYRNKKRLDHPGAIMFYAMSISCGFAVSENILYCQQFGGEVLLVRTFSAVLVHLICGLIMGYFVALGRIKKDIPDNNISSFRPRVRMIGHTICGICAATFYHGLYDFNIYINDTDAMNKLMIIVLAGILLTYAMSKHLFRYFTRSSF